VGIINKINKAIAEFEQRESRQPTPEELAEITNIPIEKILQTKQVSGRQKSLDAPLVEGEDSQLKDVIANPDAPRADEALMRESLKIEIERALSTLTRREADVLRFYYGIDAPEMTLDEIADHFGLTRERVRQIKEKALKRLRHGIRSEILRKYLG